MKKKTTAKAKPKVTDRVPDMIRISDIEIRPDFQVRVTIEADTVDEYASHLDEGGELDPIHIFENEKAGKDDVVKLPYYNSDGFHRIEAYKKAQRGKIPAIIHSGEEHEALELAIEKNSHHGHQMTNADKRKAVKMALENPVLRRRSNTALARMCGTSPTFITRMRDGKVKPEGSGPRKKNKRAQRELPISTRVGGEPEAEETSVTSAEERMTNLKTWLKGGFVDFPMVLDMLRAVEKKHAFLGVPKDKHGIKVVVIQGGEFIKESVVEDVVVKNGALEITIAKEEEMPV